MLEWAWRLRYTRAVRGIRATALSAALALSTGACDRWPVYQHLDGTDPIPSDVDPRAAFDLSCAEFEENRL